METRLFVGGAYVDSASSRRIADLEPATGRQLAQIHEAVTDDVARAVAAARKAADNGPGRGCRVARLHHRSLRRCNRTPRKELGTLEARDVGKPVAECVGHDVPRAAKNLRFFAAASNLDAGMPQ